MFNLHLQKGSSGRVARQSSAKARTAVRIRSRPLLQTPHHFRWGVFVGTPPRGCKRLAGFKTQSTSGFRATRYWYNPTSVLGRDRAAHPYSQQWFVQDIKSARFGSVTSAEQPLVVVRFYCFPARLTKMSKPYCIYKDQVLPN